jgi:hypothetical protein
VRNVIRSLLFGALTSFETRYRSAVRSSRSATRSARSGGRGWPAPTLVSGSPTKPSPATTPRPPTRVTMIGNRTGMVFLNGQYRQRVRWKQPIPQRFCGLAPVRNGSAEDQRRRRNRAALGGRRAPVLEPPSSLRACGEGPENGCAEPLRYPSRPTPRRLRPDLTWRTVVSCRGHQRAESVERGRRDHPVGHSCRHRGAGSSPSVRCNFFRGFRSSDTSGSMITMASRRGGSRAEGGGTSRALSGGEGSGRAWSNRVAHGAKSPESGFFVGAGHRVAPGTSARLGMLGICRQRKKR